MAAETETPCKRTRSPPLPAVFCLYADGPSRCHLCAERAALTVHLGRVSVAHRWLDAADSTLPEAVKVETLDIAEPSGGERPPLWA
jgi:hypothetical protein